MSTILWIVIAVGALVLLAVLFASARSGRRRRYETRRVEARDMRREAQIRGARADRVQAEAEERAARARREEAIATEQAAHAEREQRFSRERHVEADRLDPDVDAKRRARDRDGDGRIEGDGPVTDDSRREGVSEERSEYVERGR